MARKPKDKARSIVITALGHRILRAVERGTYKFWEQSKQKRGKNGRYRAA